jgi:hypothetical protein
LPGLQAAGTGGPPGVARRYEVVVRAKLRKVRLEQFSAV